MTETQSNNIEYYMIEYASKMNDEVDIDTAIKLLRQFLGVLNEDGPYAFLLYLQSNYKEDDKKKPTKEGIIVKKVADNISDFLNNNDNPLKSIFKSNSSVNQSNNKTNVKKIIDELKEYCKDAAKNLNKIFFFKEVLEKLLSYALFDARARKSTN